jgi:hypothetical protein
VSSLPSATRETWLTQSRSIGSPAADQDGHWRFPRSVLVIIHSCPVREGASRAPDQLRCVVHCEPAVLLCKMRGREGGPPMSEAQRRCNQCRLPVEADAASCPECVGEEFVWVRGPALADLIARYRDVHAPHLPFGEAPMVRCAFCGGRIEAAQA